MRQENIYAQSALRFAVPPAHHLVMANKKADPRPNQIRAWREFHELSQEKLAEMIQRSQETVARYERGSIDIPTSALNALALALNCSTEDLLRRPPGTADAVIETFRQLSPAAQKQALAVIKALKDNEEAA